MRRRGLCLGMAVMILLAVLPAAQADAPFTDTEFQGKFTSENLDAIIEKYELYDGWYWTTLADVEQTFHGQEGKPGWTDSAVNGKDKKTDYDKAYFGCRWGMDVIRAQWPNDRGWGECFGFAQFIGYLLSGERNPHKNWNSYYSVKAAGGLKVGDLVRTEYRKGGVEYNHSAVVYSIDGDEILFIQASGRNFNLLRIRTGYTDGNLIDETSLEVFSALPGVRVIRCPDNQ